MSAHPQRHPTPWWKSPAANTAVRILHGRFTGLTVVVVGVALCAAFINDRALRELSDAIIFSVLVVFAMRIVGRRLRLLMVILALPAVLVHWTRVLTGLIPAWVVFASSSALLTMITMIVLFSVLRDEAISADTIVGAVCAYFLMGVTWGTAYSMVESASPGSFEVSAALTRAANWGAPDVPMMPLMQYYSFTALSTLGMGDVSPLSTSARILTALEGMTGQLYLAVLIARLVGIHTARSNRR